MQMQISMSLEIQTQRWSQCKHKFDSRDKFKCQCKCRCEFKCEGKCKYECKYKIFLILEFFYTRDSCIKVILFLSSEK